MSNPDLRKTYGFVANPLNKSLINELREKGEEVLVFPALQPKKLEPDERAAKFIKNPAYFDWLIFMDVYAAEFFIEAMRERETELFELDNLTVCALGEAVADRLRFVQVHADVIPPSPAAEAVFAAISRFASGGLSQTRFLILRENSENFGLVELLKRENALVVELPLYAAGFENETELIRLKALLKGGAVDEFVFSTPEDVLGLKFLFPEDEFQQLFKEVKATATSEIVFQTLQENKLRPLYFHHK
jgi:uroporphyrinogen-III synthase